MPWIAVLLPMLLLGCASTLPNKAVVVSALKADRIAQGAARCPTQTSAAGQAAILGYLDKAAPDKGLDTLATEWERLNDASGVCRTGRSP
jgi:hypothetical protein